MHTLAWVAWVVLVMAVALTASNPFYLGIVLLSVLLVAALAPRTSNAAVASFRMLLVGGLALVFLSLVVALVNGSGGGHVLFTIPGPRVPEWLGGLRVGGPVTGEGLVAAAIRGLAILCVVLAFGVFNGAVSPHRVLRTAPAALFHAGLVVTIGLTLLPATVDDIRRLREMRALRGAPGGVRHLPALVVPAVTGGLERSMRLAEAMEARGYAAGGPPARLPALLGALSAPLLLAGAWGWYYYPGSRPLAGLAALAGVAALTAWLALSARGRHTTRLQSEPLTFVDRLCVAAALLFALSAVGGQVTGWVDLRYNPFAGLLPPDFTLAGGLIALACAWPTLPLALAPSRAAAAAEATPVGEPVRP
ncbi:MAG: hypothetical protein IT304_07675 [Dehalococcoidia bacterium]|nr:hypothetical protein [Dehalococcoidia bacterium]